MKEPWLNVALLEAISRICVENYVPLQYYFLSLWRESINERIKTQSHTQWWGTTMLSICACFRF